MQKKAVDLFLRDIWPQRVAKRRHGKVTSALEQVVALFRHWKMQTCLVVDIWATPVRGLAISNFNN